LCVGFVECFEICADHLNLIGLKIRFPLTCILDDPRKDDFAVLHDTHASDITIIKRLSALSVSHSGQQ